MTTAFESGEVPPILVQHRLRIAREYAGYEQEELAELIGVSRNTVGNAEKGRVTPRPITLKMWALVCGVPLRWLEHGGADKSPNPDPCQDQPSMEPVVASIRNIAPKSSDTNAISGLRHWTGTTLLDDGADLRTVQELLRHKSVATTQGYTKVPDERRHEAINRLDPYRAA